MKAVGEGALLESVVFLDHFADLPDPRQLSKVIYPLGEILLLSSLAVLAGAETFTAIAQRCSVAQAAQQACLPLRGLPRDIFAIS